MAQSQYADSVKDFGDQLTESLERMQEFQLEQMRAWQQGFAQIASTMQLPQLPGSDLFPSMKNMVKANFKLAERLLDNQKKFAMSVSEVLDTPVEESKDS